MPPLASMNTILETVPSVVTEPQITRFKFYLDQSVQDGMTYQNELYRLAQAFPSRDRQTAYRYGCELVGQGVPTIISVSKQHYLVWISLRNPVATAWNPV